MKQFYILNNRINKFISLYIHLYINGEYEGEDAVGRLMHDFKCEKLEEMFSNILRETASYYKETKEGQRVMCEIWDEIRAEGKTEGKAIGLRALVSILKPMLNDISAIYAVIKENETYSEITEEDVRKIYTVV